MSLIQSWLLAGTSPATVRTAPNHAKILNSQAKYVSLTNLFAVMALIICLFYITAYVVAGDLHAGAATAGLELFILISIGLNLRGFHYIARHLLIGGLNVAIFTYASWLGQESGVYLTFFASMANTVMLFDPRDWPHAAAALIPSFCGLLVLGTFPHPLAFLPPPVPIFFATNATTSLVVSAMTLLVACFTFSRTVARSEHVAADASDRLDQEMGRVKLLQDVAIIANNAESLDQAVRATISRISELLGWSTGRFVRYNAITWQACGFKRDLLVYRRAAWQALPLKGHWCQECEAMAESRAPSQGPKILVGVPVAAKGQDEIIGILQFTAGWDQPPSIEMLANLDAIGRQLGIVEERRRAAAEVGESHLKMLAAAKMATLGEMAGGIAHEINNPLAVIQGHLARIQKHVAWPDAATRTESEIQAITATLMRITKIVNGLRAFARDSTNDPFESVPVARLIQDALTLSSERFKNRGIELVVAPVDPSWTLECRPSQISQVLLNLLNNAFDAVQALRPANTHAWPRVSLAVAASGDRWQFTVSDDGPGISEAIQTRVLEPFFTTKPVGSGTGLGLSISKGLVESHGGTMEFTSRPGATIFTLRLPRKQPQGT